MTRRRRSMFNVNIHKEKDRTARTITNNNTKKENLKNTFANFLAVAALAATLSVCTSARAASIDQPTTCQQSQLTVALEAGQPATYHVTGQLCYKPNNKNIVHLLVSGATYSRAYWDFPLQPQQYSYVRALTNAGYATFNFDSIGIGESDHPQADQVPVQSPALVVILRVYAWRYA